MPRPKNLCAKKLFSDEEIKKKEGHWFEESDIKYPIISSNTDVYRIDDEGNKFIMYVKNHGNQHNALQQELEHFVNSIQNGTEPLINGDVARDALNVALIIQDKINGN